MNPCRKNKRRIAWLASGVLDAADADALRHHLKGCPGCRDYWESMAELSERLVNASAPPEAEPAPSFHRRIVQGINAAEKRSALVCFFDTFRALWAERRVATIAVCVVIGFATLLWTKKFGRDEPHVPIAAAVVHIPETMQRAASQSTLASYRQAADISLERLDAILTYQAGRIDSASETFSVSSLLTASDN